MADSIPYDKLIEAENITVKEFQLEEETSLFFERSLDDLAKELNVNQNAVGFLVGFYRQKPSADLRKNIRKAEKKFSERGIGSGRHYKIFVPWFGMEDADDPELSFPSLLLIDIKSSSLGSTR